MTVEDVELVSRKSAKINLNAKQLVEMEKSAAILQQLVKNRQPIYGVSTQFGSDVILRDSNLNNGSEINYFLSLKERQLNLIKSLNCGLGEKVSKDIIRAAVLLRLNSLLQGASGVRPTVVKELANFLNQNKDINNLVIKRYGSIGASGDLIPLSEIAFVLSKRINFEPKEGLALVNGTSFMSAIAALTIYDLVKLFPAMLSSLGMALEALLVLKDAYHPFVHKIKNYEGQIKIADFFIKFWSKSKLFDEASLQDFYSLRAVPQGFGPFYENIKKAKDWVEREINAASDNPVISLKPPKVYNAANFMGYYITEACDILKMDIAQASSWIHAILANLVHPRKNKGLPSNLIMRPDKYSGCKPLQVLAASLVVQNRKLAVPVQAVMIPTEGDNQDVNSLGAHAAFDLKEAFENLERLTAILLLVGAQAIELRGVKKAGIESRKLHKFIRSQAAFLNKDRSLGNDLEKIIFAIRQKNFGVISFFNLK